MTRDNGSRRGDPLSGPEAVRERIDARSLVVTPPARHRFDVAVRQAFPTAELIQPLTRRTRARGWRWWLDLVVGPGAVDLAQQLSGFAGFYLVREAGPGSAQWLVKVTDTELVRAPWTQPASRRRIVVGDNVLTKAPYTL